NALGALAFGLIGERRSVTRINLAKCFPWMAAAERERLARAHFGTWSRSFLDHALLWWSPREQIERLVRIEGLEHLRALGGGPAILFVPHFVGLDAGFARLACEIDMVSMYAQQKNPLLAARLLAGRMRFGRQKLVSRQEGIRAVLGTMSEGRPLYYLPDMDYGPRGALFVPFFGVSAATMPGLSRIARVTGAKVLPCVTHMLPGAAGYVVSIEAPWHDFPTHDPAADTRRMNEYIERRVLEAPEQYFWMHKRFKTRPESEARFYA
ncbi:MAG: lysophospholipid acyltransferase family protein, partial [Burkholderiales bacterium]